MQPAEIFSQPSVNGLSETEDILHDSVGVFYFAVHSGFAVLNIPLIRRIVAEERVAKDV